MKKRTIKIGTYDTAAHGWTLTGCTLSAPEQKTLYVEKTGGDGSWDLSTVHSEGVPLYKDRTLTATLELSKGTRADREEVINEMLNQLDGLQWPIILPDRPSHYLTGRVHVAVDYSDLAHAAVTITATTEPWLYNSREAVVVLEADVAPQTASIHNGGRRTVVPVLRTTGPVTLTYGTLTTELPNEGAYEWTALMLTPGRHALEYSGAGTITLTYREAVLR